MFHPANFSITHKDRQRENTSFVGIRRNGPGDQRFVLPPGFDDFPVSDAATVSEYFFKLFRVLRQFRRYVEKYDQDEESDFAGDSGIRISAKETEPAMLYSKIRMLEEVLERYDELRIYNILYRNRRTEDIDYSQIHRYLDKAVYQDDIPYVDEMRLSRPVVEMDVSDLVRMFCFIYTEVSVRTGNECSPEVEAAANQFKAEHLDPDSTLFERLDAHRRTVDLLKKKLDDIDRETTYKDEDYWYFFEAVEEFLYGELDEEDDGISWGITRFAPVWEDMCMVWLHESRWGSVVYADSKRYANDRIKEHDLYVDTAFDSPFALELGGYPRSMRPDIVRQTSKRNLADAKDVFEVKKVRPLTFKVRVEDEHREEKTKKMISFVKEEKREKLTNRSRRSGKSYWCEMSNVSQEEVWGVLNKYDEFKEEKKDKEVWRVIDFKCVPGRIYRPGNLKARKDQKPYLDERKQITYEYALQLDGADETTSQLCVPTYYNNSVDEIGNEIEKRHIHKKLNTQGIGVIRVDFDQVLEEYLEYEDAESNHA